MSRPAQPGETRQVDSKELEETLAALREACYTHPEQRTAQVISNALAAFGGPRDIFYVEDGPLLDALRDYKD